CLYFFFQAEDGIRDFHVTGVQTCALPISSSVGGTLHRRATAQSLATPGPVFRRITTRLACATSPVGRRLCRPPARHASPSGCRRSEERRVGKEGRSRGERDQSRKKTRGSG